MGVLDDQRPPKLSDYGQRQLTKSRTGSPVTPAAVELDDGAALLDEVRGALTRYCILPSDATTDAVVLWVAATHCLPAFDYAPRLVIRSAEKRSGKSRLLEVADALCHSPLRIVNASVAYVFRSLGETHPPTLLIDEADSIFGTKVKAEQNEDLRGLLNAGYQRGLNYGRTVGPMHTPTEFPTFAMAALAGIGQMPDTIEDRAVVVEMRRRKPSETVQPYRRRRDEPGLHELCDRLAVWAAEHLDALTEAEPDLPVEDRAADTWEPLVAVADAAGGHWPQRARAAAVHLTTEAAAHDAEVSLNVKLLGDVRAVFAELRVPFLKSAALCQALHEVEDAPWGDWELNPSKLGHRLKDYSIRTAHNTDKSARGYRIEDFHDAWERYLPAADPSEGVQGVPQAPDQQKQPDALQTPDTLKASGDPKASHHNRRSDPVRTPPDAFGRHPACVVCGKPVTSGQGDRHLSCEAAA